MYDLNHTPQEKWRKNAKNKINLHKAKKDIVNKITMTTNPIITTAVTQSNLLICQRSCCYGNRTLSAFLKSSVNCYGNKTLRENSALFK